MLLTVQRSRGNGGTPDMRIQETDYWGKHSSCMTGVMESLQEIQYSRPCGLSREDPFQAPWIDLFYKALGSTRPGFMEWEKGGHAEVCLSERQTVLAHPPSPAIIGSLVWHRAERSCAWGQGNSREGRPPSLSLGCPLAGSAAVMHISGLRSKY